jgi:oligosaccharide repeat unit polymerase
VNDIRKISLKAISRVLTVLAAILAYVVCASIFIKYLPDNYLFEGTVIILMVFLILSAFALYHYKFSNPLTIFSPLYMVVLPYTIYFVIFPMDMIFRNKELVPGQEQYMPRTMVYLFLGLTAYLGGFFCVLYRNRKRISHSEVVFSQNSSLQNAMNFNTKKAALISFLSFVIGVAIWLYLVIKAGGIVYILENLNRVYLEFFSTNMYLISIINSFYFVNISLHFGIVIKRKKGYSLLILNCLLVLSLLLVQGSRGSIIAVFFFMLIAIHLYIKRLKILHVAVIFCCIVLFMIGWLYQRDVLDPSIVSPSDLVYNALISVNDEMTLMLNFVMNMPDMLGYKYGSSFLQLFLMPVPRAIWPEKPAVFQVETTHIFLPQYSALQFNWPPSIVGELYANFHIIGIVLGMLVFGYLSGRLQIYALRSNSYYRILLYSIMLFVVFREVRGDFVTVTSLLLMQLAVFVTLGQLVFRKRPYLFEKIT